MNRLKVLLQLFFKQASFHPKVRLGMIVLSFCGLFFGCSTQEQNLNEGVKIKFVTPKPFQILSPKDDSNLNLAGIQTDISLQFEEPPSNAQAFLSVNGRVAQMLALKGKSLTFPKVTLEDGRNTLQLKLLLSDKTTLLSENLIILADLHCSPLAFQLKNAQILTSNKDVDKAKKGFQYDIEVDVAANSQEEVSLEITSTKSQKQLFKQTQFPQNGKVVFKAVTLPVETLQLTTFHKDLAGNVCGDNIEIEVKDSGTSTEEPSLTCLLIQGPAFNDKNESSLNKTHDTDAKNPGFQNGLVCESDAELGQSVELELGGQKKSEKLSENKSKHNVTFKDLTFQEGENTLTVKVVNQSGKSKQISYKIFVKTKEQLSQITDFSFKLTDHRQVSLQLTWTAPKKDASSNPVSGYQIRWTNQETSITEKNWEQLKNKMEQKTSPAPGQTVTADVKDLKLNKKYLFAIRAFDKDGKLLSLSNIVTLETKLKTESAASSKDGEQYGNQASIVGDIDNDGTPDLILCHYDASVQSTSKAGAAYVYFGRKIKTEGSYLPANGSPDLIIRGDSENHHFCKAITPLGDLNGDSFADFAISAPGAEGGKGKVYVFLGAKRSSLQSEQASKLASVIVTGEQSGSGFGNKLHAIGIYGQADLNGDKIADLLITAPEAKNTGTTNLGTVYAFFGLKAYPSAGQSKAQKESETNLKWINDQDSGKSGFGLAVSSADLNADGFTDLLLGSPGAAKVRIFFGSDPSQTLPTSILAQNASITITGSALSKFGSSIAMIGDVDKDQKADLLIGAPNETVKQAGKEINGAGKAYIFSGQKLVSGGTLKETDASVSYHGEQQDDHLGLQVSSAGDFDQDGFADFLIAAPHAKQKAGSVFLLKGQSFATLQSGAASSHSLFRWNGSSPNQQLGSSYVFGGIDLTGDQYPDLLFTETPSSSAKQKSSFLLKY